MWLAAVGGPYPMEKNPDEIPMFTRFVECGLALPASITVSSTSISTPTSSSTLLSSSIFCEAFLGIKPHWVLFRKFFRVKPQPSANDLRVVRGAGIQMREDVAE
jgi:hypothetical protein